MLAKRIIPCLDVLDGEVVKGIQFKGLEEAGDPIELAKWYYEQNADELVFLDVGASPEERETMYDVVEKTAEQLFIPLTVGGGVRSVDDVAMMLKSGADKVGINTAAVENPDLITKSSRKFGRQCIVVAIDAKKTGDNGWEVYTYGGREATGVDVVEWAEKVESLGAGEILLTSMDADGTKDGYELKLTRTISERVNVPVIASGGAGGPKHIYEALTEGSADAALAASIFHYGEYSVNEVKEYLEERQVPVRF